jgi:hypothetical protein
VTSDGDCLDCELLDLQGVEYEVVTNTCGQHVRHYVNRVESDTTDLKED